MTIAGVRPSQSSNPLAPSELGTSMVRLLGTFVIAVFAITTAGAQTYTDLFDFDGPNYGSYPVAPGLLAQGRDGNLYGTANSGGPYANGTAFRITPRGQINLLYQFGADGYPFSGLTLGTSGNFYGSTAIGGSPACNYPYGCGFVFEMTPSGTVTDIYDPSGGNDYTWDYAPPIQGIDGNLYGTALLTAYKITSAGPSILAAIPDYSQAPLIQASDGKFYGMTSYGGTLRAGTVFSLTPMGVVSVLHNFNLLQGQYPVGPVVQGNDGDLYGTTRFGGTFDGGVVFKLTPSGAFTVLHNFPDPDVPSDGMNCFAGLVQASDGNFYGTTLGGGSAGVGLFFRITPAGVYSVLYNFDGSHGANPASTPMQHTNGKIYGTTEYGGRSNLGTVYSLDLGLPQLVHLVLNAAHVGTRVEILGQGFSGTTTVSFNGTSASFAIFSNTYMTAIVPPGATSGPVAVITSRGSLVSDRTFQVLPAIFSFDPPIGPVGTSVVLSGTGLTQTKHISFGGVPASFTVESDTRVTTVVPAGAKTGTIQIGTPGGFASSSQVFTLTP